MTGRPAHLLGSATRTHCGLSPKDDPVPIIARRSDDATCTPCVRSALSLSEARCAALERNLFGTTPRPYTDAELARGQDDTRDQTLTLALLADRVTALEAYVGALVDTVNDRVTALEHHTHPVNGSRTLAPGGA